MINHVWFDMGGTLFQETPAFDEAHDKLRFDAYAAITGEQDPGLAKAGYMELYAQYGSNSAVFSSLGKASDYWQTIFDDLDLAKVLIPDASVSQTITEISGVMPVSLFSNFKPHKIESVLNILGIPPVTFTHVISGDDVQRRKPAPDGFEKMIELSDLPPNQILYVGDRVDVDIKPAKELGMLTCLLWQESETADFTAMDYPELLRIIKDNS